MGVYEIERYSSRLILELLILQVSPRAAHVRRGAFAQCGHFLGHH
jgi:hypothetical protein